MFPSGWCIDLFVDVTLTYNGHVYTASGWLRARGPCNMMQPDLSGGTWRRVWYVALGRHYFQVTGIVILGISMSLFVNQPLVSGN